MLKQLSLYTAIIILIGIGFVLYVNSEQVDENEVSGEGFHGYLAYEDWTVDEKFAKRKIVEIIFKFEQSITSFIDEELNSKPECKKRILDRLHEYKRYYQLWTNGDNRLHVTFTHKQLFELSYLTIKDEPWIMDGGTSQFRISYDYNYERIVYFGINGPLCHYSVRPET